MDSPVAAVFLKAVDAHKEGRLAQAEHFYRAVIGSDPAHADANHNLGLLAVAVGKPSAALPFLKQAVDARPDDPRLWMSYIETLVAVGAHALARETLAQARQRGIPSRMLEAAEKLCANSAPASSLAPQSPSVSADGTSPIASALGISPPASVPAELEPQVSAFFSHFNRVEMSHAEKVALALVRGHPNFQFGWKALGVVLKKNAQFGTAPLVMKTAVDLAPDDAEAHAWLGAIMMSMDRPAEAEPSFRRALELQPGRLEVIHQLAQSLRRQGRDEEAAGLFRRLVEAGGAHPDSAGVLHYTALAFEALGHQEAALKAFGAVLAHDPSHCGAHAILGKDCLKKGQTDRGLTHLSQAAEDAQHITGYIDALIENGRAQEALDVWHGRFLRYGKLNAYDKTFWARYPRILQAVDGLNQWFRRALDAHGAGHDFLMPDSIPTPMSDALAKSCRPGKKIVLVSYASAPNFRDAQRSLNEGALRNAGITEVVPWSEGDLKATRFFKHFQPLLDMPRGSGYWVWKPFIILQQMLALRDGDYVVYHDTGWVAGGFYFDRSIEPLIDWCDARSHGVFLGLPMYSGLNRAWAKRDCYRLMGCDNEAYWQAPQISATWSVWRRSPEAIQFLCDWLGFATDPRVSTDYPNTQGHENLPEFIDHRHDQAILTCLVRQYGAPFEVFGDLQVGRECNLAWMNDTAWSRKSMPAFIERLSNPALD